MGTAPAKWKSILVFVLYITIETKCLSVERNTDRRSSNIDTERNEYSLTKQRDIDKLRKILYGTVDSLEDENQDSKDSRKNHPSEERFGILHPQNTSKRSVLNQSFNDSSEEDHSSEEIFRDVRPSTVFKTSTLNQRFNGSSEDHSSEERYGNLKVLKRNIEENVSDKTSEESDEDIRNSREGITQSPYSLQTSDKHILRRNILNNLRDADHHYLEEDIYKQESNEDKVIENEEHNYENDDTNLFNDEYSDESKDTNDVYEKYIDKIAEEYGYKSNEDHDEDENGEELKNEGDEPVGDRDERDEDDFKRQVPKDSYEIRRPTNLL